MALMRKSLLLAVALVLVGGVAYASIPGPDGVIHGCRKNSDGQLRVIDSAATCSNGWTALNWSSDTKPVFQTLTQRRTPQSNPNQYVTVQYWDTLFCPDATWRPVAAGGNLFIGGGNGSAGVLAQSMSYAGYGWQLAFLPASPEVVGQSVVMDIELTCVKP